MLAILCAFYYNMSNEQLIVFILLVTIKLLLIISTNAPSKDQRLPSTVIDINELANDDQIIKLHLNSPLHTTLFNLYTSQHHLPSTNSYHPLPWPQRRSSMTSPAICWVTSTSRATSNRSSTARTGALSSSVLALSRWRRGSVAATS